MPSYNVPGANALLTADGGVGIFFVATPFEFNISAKIRITSDTQEPIDLIVLGVHFETGSVTCLSARGGFKPDLTAYTVEDGARAIQDAQLISDDVMPVAVVRQSGDLYADVCPPAPDPEVYLPVRLTNGASFYNATGGGGGGGTVDQGMAGTDPWAVAGTVDQGAAGTDPWPVEGPLTDAELRANPIDVSGIVLVSNFPVTQPVSGTVAVSNLPATQAVSAAALPLPTGAATEVTLAAIKTAVEGTLEVSGPLTDSELRATPVPVSGTFWQATQPVSGTVAVSNPGLTDTELRASAVPTTDNHTTALAPLAVRLSNGTSFYNATGGSGGGTVDQGAAGIDPWLVTGPLTDAELRATPVDVAGAVSVSNFPATQPVSAAALPLPAGAATETTLDAVKTAVEGTLAVSGPLTDTELRATAVPVSGTFWQATQPVSGTVGVSNFPAVQPVSDNGGSLTVDGTVGISGTVPVSGPLTDTELRATPVPVSGTVTATGPLTDAQLRATPISVSDGDIDPNNSSTANIAAFSTFTGTATDVSGYGLVCVSISKGAILGSMSVQFSTDGTNWDFTEDHTTSVSDFSVEATPKARWFRVVVSNFSGGIMTPRLQSVLKRTGFAAASYIQGTAGGIFDVTPSRAGVLLSEPSYPSLLGGLATRVLSLPLATGASTAAKQPAFGTAGTASADVLTVQGIASMTALKVDGSAVVQPVSGPLTNTELRATPVPVSGTVTASGPLTNTELRALAVPVSGPLTNTELRALAVPVSGTVTASGPLTNTELRASVVPVSLADSTNGPVTVKAASTAAVAADLALVVAVSPNNVITVHDHAPLTSAIDGVLTLTSTGDTQLIAAQGGSTRIYITSLSCSNTSATGVRIDFKDGSTVKHSFYLAPTGGGASHIFPFPWRLTANTALNAAISANVTDVRVSATGFTAL